MITIWTCFHVTVTSTFITGNLYQSTGDTLNFMFFGSRDCLAHDEDFRLEVINLSCKKNYLLTHTESREKEKKQPIININMEN